MNQHPFPFRSFRETLAVRRRERGTALVISLIMLAGLTLMATEAVQSAVMALKISRNGEEAANAFQAAQSGIDYVMSDSSLLPMTGELNTPTPVAVTGSPFVIDTSAGETLAASAERTMDCGAPPRLSSGSSLLTYSTFSFRIAASVDRTATGRGQSSIRQGYLVLGPKC